jgi:hypothetical protein
MAEYVAQPITGSKCLCCEDRHGVLWVLCELQGVRKLTPLTRLTILQAIGYPFRFPAAAPPAWSSPSGIGTGAQSEGAGETGRAEAKRVGNAQPWRRDTLRLGEKPFSTGPTKSTT